MADLIRGYPWHITPLGAMENWSDTLVASVNAMLLSPFSAALFWGEEYRLLYNEVYRAFLGEKHPGALGSKGAEVWKEAWPTIGAPMRDAFEKGLSTGERAALVPILINGHLEDRWWTYGFNPIYENGKIVGVANPGAEDTAFVKADQALRRSEEALQLTMESAALGMWTYDPVTNVVLANDQMHRIFGAPDRNGAVDYWLTLLHPEDRERVGEHFAGALAGRHPYEIEYRILRNGEVRWVRSKGRVVGPADRPERMLAIIEDITERKQAEAALQQTEKLVAVGRLASSIAHEINNPLEAITNLLYLAKSSETLPEAQHYIDTAERELRRISLITNQTLRFHRQSTKPIPAFCYDLIGDSLAIYQSRLINNHIEVEKRKRAEHPIECLDGEIRQVLNNLIGNSVDAMPTGGRLILRSREAKNWSTGARGIVLTVADTGIGMSPEVRKRIFEAFYTTKGIGGTGLGLWVSCEIVARHHGKLSVRSSQMAGRSGTVFTLFLPFEGSVQRERHGA